MHNSHVFIDGKNKCHPVNRWRLLKSWKQKTPCVKLKKIYEKKIGGVKWRAVPAKIDFGARLLSIWQSQVKYGWKRGGKPVLRVKLIPNDPSIWNNFNLFSENDCACVSDYLCSFCNYTALMAPANLTLQHSDLLVIKTLDHQAFYIYANVTDSATGDIMDLNDIPDCPEGIMEDLGWLRLSLCTQIKSKSPRIERDKSRINWPIMSSQYTNMPTVGVPPSPGCAAVNEKAGTICSHNCSPQTPTQRYIWCVEVLQRMLCFPSKPPANMWNYIIIYAVWLQ